MGWWQLLVIALCGALTFVSGFISVRKSGEGSRLDRMNLRRGLDAYIWWWTGSLTGAGGFITLMDIWVSPLSGVVIGALLAIAGLLWFVNSSRYLRDSQATQDQSRIDLLKGYREVDQAHGLICLAASAGVFALTLLLWNICR